jgi:sterol desaturase/sphingolipid hydroxylase (fatty acid hydroxylase superfamily)
MDTMVLVRYHSAIYWTGFVAVFLAVAVWESFQPRAPLSVPAERRWKNHGALLTISVVVNALVMRVSPVALAALAARGRHGILDRPWLPFAAQCAAAVALLDLVQYWIHWSFHRVPLLWRAHRVHHSDPDFDVSTAGRFHPLEELYTQAIRYAVIFALALPVLGVALAELLSLILNFWAHANASLPAWIERPLRWVFVTPGFHRIHHSREPADQRENLGQTFAWWDRLFGSYAEKSSTSDERFPTGLNGFEGDPLAVGFMLAEPFRSEKP